MRRACAVVLGMLTVGCASTQPGSAPNTTPGGAAAAGETAGGELQTRPADGLERVSLSNDVALCVSLKPLQLLLVGSVEIGVFGLTHLKPISECGCMSSTLAYRVTQQQEEPPGALPPGVPPLDPYQRVIGSVDVLPDTRRLSLVVSPDRSLYGTVPLTMNVGCQGPE